MKNRLLVLSLAFASLAFPSPAFAADTRPCVCHCSYQQSKTIRSPDYYDSSRFGSCGELNGKGCIGADWAGTRYSGQLDECQDAPEKLLSDIPLQNLLQLTLNTTSLSRLRSRVSMLN